MSAQTPRRQSPAVYRRRRLTVLVALIAVIALAWWGVSALLGSGAEAAPDPSPEASVSPDASPEATASVEAAAATDESPSPEPSETAAAIEECAVEQVAVSLGTEPSIKADRVTFEAEVTNTGAAPCLFAGDQADTVLQITSGDTRVWNSSDCAGTATVVGKRWVLDAGTGQTFAVSWPRAWSFEGCTEATGVPQPGAYWAALTVGGIDADRVQFVM